MEDPKISKRKADDSGTFPSFAFSHHIRKRNHCHHHSFWIDYSKSHFRSSRKETQEIQKREKSQKRKEIKKKRKKSKFSS